MKTAVCFQCSKEYPGKNEDDMAGDGRCPTCTEVAKRAAFKVDIEMAKRRSAGLGKGNERNAILKDLLNKGGRINIRELGITPRG